MKKTLMVLAFASLCAAAVFASGAKDSVTVEGKLAFTDSLPTIVSNGKTWILPVGPFYEIAYKNNIKAGDTLKVEGSEYECSADIEIKDAVMLYPTKVTVNGKALDLTLFEGRGRMGSRSGMMDGRGGMMDGRNYGGRMMRDAPYADRDERGSRGGWR